MAAGEVLAGLVGIVVINSPLHDPSAVIVWIALVVGAHFFPLASVFDQPRYRLLGGAVAGAGAAGLIEAMAGSSGVVIAVTAGLLPGDRSVGRLLLGRALRPHRGLCSR